MGRNRKAVEINHDHAMAAELKTSGALNSVSGQDVKEALREQRLEKLQLQQKQEGAKILRELLKTPIVVSNHPIKEFKDAFTSLSMEPKDWCVSYFFPVAKDAKGQVVPTYVDTPTNARQVEVCKRKSAIMEKLGKRYLVCEVSAQMTGDQIRQALSSAGDEEGGESMMNEGAMVTL